ncbi:DEHA2G22726p [Debaryomyces hansenii CBS767]|jgi:hypothetical protein|uniref:DEHA2G22726p n=1 Tax=Debaryomyces hansenii (strain ATCC 36239 / CBS 767 / BCRC 21394 / JCM 1990 / NBRC 0083 / IGC 2968) TaxID=284592 RepID=Q6BGY6_DEBHA|nr:DEHA2G22726p [Debaryomyces hansenii CBS767]CAG91045.1 DEHA2G22726p [Debaryomyces hansenii CBS767]|eukprot:XP_462535.1 DEHA2G22726p [Debaryomyces hansenii CBS767]
MNSQQNFLTLSTDISEPFVIPNVSPISIVRAETPKPQIIKNQL